jgi:hypothetical protein
MGNKGAVIQFVFADDQSVGQPEFEQFEALPCGNDSRLLKFCKFMA